MTISPKNEPHQPASPVASEVLAAFGVFVAQTMGLHFSPERRNDLERGLGMAARAFGMDDPESCALWLLGAELSRDRAEILGSCLTIGETYFFRDGMGFDALQYHVLPDLSQCPNSTPRRLRIWCAGCATGEEAYSIAILLDRTLPLRRQWELEIIATDINPHFLAKASAGTYTAWSFRNAPEWLKEGYFEHGDNGEYQVVPRIKEMVRFEYLNLADKTYPVTLGGSNSLQVIFCRNVLLYFGADRARHVLSNFHRLLASDGWLIVGPSDLLHVKQSDFALAIPKMPTVYRKFEAGTAPPSRVERPPLADSGSPAKNRPPPRPATAVRRPTNAPRPSQPAATPPDAPPPSAFAPAQAKACADTGQLTEALAWCAQAIADDKLNSALHYLRAGILQEQGLMEESASALRQTLFLDPDFVLAHFMLGNLNRSRGNAAEAERCFTNARRLLGMYAEDDILPGSEGLTAGRLAAILSRRVTS